MNPDSDWRDDAACAGANVADFYPSRDKGGMSRALALCGVCPVTAECTADATEGDILSLAIRGGIVPAGFTKVVMRTCQTCDTEFPTNGPRKFCESCRPIKRRGRGVLPGGYGRQCQTCGNPFHAAKPNQLRCETCRLERPCTGCGATFKVVSASSMRCEPCQTEHAKLSKIERTRKWRANKSEEMLELSHPVADT